MSSDLYELIAYLEEQKELGGYDIDDETSLEEFLYDYYNINIEDFEKIINDLLPLCTIAQSPLTGTWYRGFGTGHVWLLNKKVE